MDILKEEFMKGNEKRSIKLPKLVKTSKEKPLITNKNKIAHAIKTNR